MQKKKAEELTLKIQSPRARDNASSPLTLPADTNPPSFLMRCCSRGLSGLWS